MVSPGALWPLKSRGRFNRSHEQIYRNAAFMSKHPKRPHDLNQWAKHMVDLATGNAQEPDPNEGKDAAAVSLGRRDGLKGGKARAVLSENFIRRGLAS